MRTKKLRKGYSTSAERRFAELLKRNRIPFQAKIIINKHEVDFLIGKYAVEINGHKQNTDKNEMLARAGYIPIHYSNNEINSKLNVNKLSKRS